MTVTLCDGSIFSSKCLTLVNPVNCVGVMGKGPAKEFAARYPEMFKAYKRDCKAGLYYPGSPRLWTGYTVAHRPLQVLNFPTKLHWKDKSDLEFIRWGLFTLWQNFDQARILSIAFPALGCGEGGLAWDDVRPVMVDHLEKFEIPVEVYVPGPRGKVY